jgi:hypothetical protein
MLNLVHYIYLIPLLLSVIVSLKAFRNKWAKSYRLFSIFLMVTLIVELLAISWKLFLHQTAYWGYANSNLWIYNLYLAPQYLFYFIFFSSVLDSKLLRTIKKPTIIIYVFTGVFNIIFIQRINQLNTYTIILGSGLVLIGSLSYFIQEFNRKVPALVSKQPLFWIALGSFMFHTVSLPYFIMINYLSKVNLPMAISLFNILLALNVLMYLFYLIAFLCNNPSLKKQS